MQCYSMLIQEIAISLSHSGTTLQENKMEYTQRGISQANPQPILQIKNKLSRENNRAQFHRAARHKKIANIKYEMSSLIKTGLPTKCPRDFEEKQTTAEYQ